MTTTSHFQKNPDYYMNIEDCKNRPTYNTNPRYKFFKQTIFTAGDEQQFEMYRDRSNGCICIENIDLSDNIFKDMTVGEHLDWEKYQNLTATSVDNTFKYMFHKMKKGLFIKIKNGKLDVYLPFSKVDYVNEWSDKIKYDKSRFNSIEDFFAYIYKLNGKTFDPKRYNKNINTWFGNNCMFRTEFPIFEGDASYTNFQDMFKTLCEERQVPDCELFLNKRDFPYIKLDSTEPYDSIYEEGTPLVSHNYDKYAPILGMVTTDVNADIPMPTWEDWARVSSEEDGKIFDTCRTYTEQFNIPWSEKKPIGVFRGSSTGCGTTPETNPRIKLAVMGKNPQIDESDGLPLIDTGVTQWNIRARKEPENEYLTTIEVKTLGLEAASPLSPQQQSSYKYIINVDGHVSAYRLSLEMRMGSVILLADSKYRMWFRNYLVPYVHYIPLKSDLSDLYEKILWCKSNDKKCEEIAQNAKKFYYTYLTKDAVLDYMQKLLVDLKSHTGVYVYNWTDPFAQQIEEEKIFIDEKMNEKVIFKSFNIPRHFRTYGYFEFMRSIFNTLDDKLIDNLTKVKDLAESRTIKVEQYSFNGMNLVIKWNKTIEKINENIHEIFLSYAYLNRLLADIPNFVYNFKLVQKSEDIGVLSEYIDGITFEEYIRSDRFNMIDYMSVLLQLNLAIRVAQVRCGFVHWDLYPLNIMIKFLDRPIKIDYVLSKDCIYTVETSIIPIIIDYGKSHIVHDSKHHGLIDLYQMNLFQDSFTLLCTSGIEVIQKRLDRQDFTSIMTLFNWLSSTHFIPKRFNNAKELKDFLYNAKKYSYILLQDKKDVITINPEVFIDFIIRTFRLSIIIRKNMRKTIHPFVMSPLALYHLNNSNTEQSVKNIFENIRSKCVYKNKIKFFNMYEYFTIYKHMNWIMQTIENINNKLLPVANMEYSKTMMHIKDTLKQDDYTNIEYDVLDKLPFNPLYNYKTFYDRFKMLELTEKVNFKSIYKNYIQYRQDVVDMMLSELFNRDDILKLEKNFSQLLKVEPFEQWSIISDIITFKYIVKTIIRDDAKHIIRDINTYKKSNCKNSNDAREILDDYKKIIKSV
jgi:hypothetical protein